MNPMSSQIQTQSDAVDSDCLLLFSFHNLQIDFRGFLVKCHKTKTKNTFFLLTFAAGINRAVIQSETQGCDVFFLLIGWNGVMQFSQLGSKGISCVPVNNIKTLGWKLLYLVHVHTCCEAYCYYY